jgi:hypothetical protein
VRTRLLGALPPLHGLRAELLAAEAEIVAATDAAAAARLREQAGAEYQRMFGSPMPARLLSLH